MLPLTVGLLMTKSPLAEAVQGCLRNLPVRVVMEADPAGEIILLQNQFKRYTPEAVLIDLTQIRSRFHELMGMIRALPAIPAVIAVHNTPDPETILSALRAGASEFLYPPFAEGIMRQALDRIAGQRALQESRRPDARTIGFLSAMGGCGATTAACHVASELQRQTKKEVLLADLDPVAGLVGFWLNAKTPHSILDAARNVHRMDTSLWKGLLAVIKPSFHVMTAPADAVLEDHFGTEGFVEVLRFARQNYDWVVADLGHSLSPFTAALLGEMDTLYLVTSPEIAALFQARRILRALPEVKFDPQSVKLVLSRTSKRQNFNSDELEKLLGIPVDACLVSDPEEIEDARGESRLISPTSELGRQLARLTGQISGAPQGEKARSRFSMFKPFRLQEL